MAELKNDGKVMVINPKQWQTLQDISTGGKRWGWQIRDLLQAGIIDDYGLTAASSAILSGFLLSQSHVQTNVLNARGVRRIDLWLSSEMVTLGQLLNPKEYHIRAMEPAEVPNAMLQLLDLVPRPQSSEGDFAITAEALEAAFEGDYNQLRRLLLSTASEIPESVLAQTIFDDSWSLTLSMLNKRVGDESETQDMAIFFTVPDCLYLVFTEPDAQDLHQMGAVNSSTLWHALSEWYVV